MSTNSEPSTPRSHKRSISEDVSTPNANSFSSNREPGSRSRKRERMDPERLNDILEDFDAEVEARIQKIRINAKLCADRLKRDLDIQLTGMNTVIRKMTVKEFREKYDEDVDRVLQAESNDIMFSKNQILSRISSIQTSTATMTTPRKPSHATHSVHQSFNFKTPAKTPKKIVYATPSNNVNSTQPVRRRKEESLNKENLSQTTKAPYSLLLGSDKININSPSAKHKIAQDPTAIQELLKFQAQLQSILSAVNTTSTIN